MFSTYVINMDAQPDRFVTQREYLRQTGIEPTRVHGYAYDEIQKSEIERFFKPHARVIMPKSNVGCCYSHLKALERFLASGISPVALILEDDAYPLFIDRRHLEDKIRGTNLDWDFLFLHCDGFCPEGGGAPGRLSASAAAYFVTRDGARKALLHKYSDHFDMDSSRIPGVRKLIDGENSFWTDEDGVMTQEKSTNRNARHCPDALTKIKGNRGEKNLCHAMAYRLFRVGPITVDSMHVLTAAIGLIVLKLLKNAQVM
jgi:hypothetical protein